VAGIALGIGSIARHLRKSVLEWPFTLFIFARHVPGVVLGTGLLLKVPDQATHIDLVILTIVLCLFSSISILNGSLTSSTGVFVTILLISWFGAKLIAL